MRPTGWALSAATTLTNADPCGRGNLLSISLVAPPSKPAPSREIGRYTYEPQFHRLKTLKDELGRTTTWEYDYETVPGGVGDVVAIAYPDGDAPRRTTQGRRETFEYDGWGCLVAHTTGAGHRHEFGYSEPEPTSGSSTRSPGT